MRPHTWLSALAVLLVPTVAWSQDPLKVAAGHRIRITERGVGGRELRCGTVAAASPDTVVLRLDGVENARSVAWSELSRVEISRGRERHTLTGAMLGLVAGAVSGAILGATECKVSCSGEMSGNKGIAPVIGAGVVGVVGMGLGAAIGAIYTTEKWERVPQSGWHAGGRQVHSRGLTIAVSVGF